MRIGVFAQAAGTTPRAVRHYHRLGLIPDPARTPSGYRDYSMSDVVRLMKVRRLAESGVPLGNIAAMIVDDSRGDVVDDINDLLSGIEREQKMLETKKSRLLGLLVDAREGRPLTALPRHLADRLTQLIEQNDGVARVELQRERDHLEVLALSGNLPDALADAMADGLQDSTSVTSYLSVLKRWAALDGKNPTADFDEIDALATEVAALVAVYVGRTPSIDTAARTDPFILELHDVVPDPAQRAVVLRAASILNDGVR